MDLKKKTIDYANSIGVDLIGFTNAEAFEDIRCVLEKRKKLGHLSGFEEKDIELRIDPKRTMPEAQSIIVIALSYYKNLPKVEAQGNLVYKGKLSRTAWGLDYHNVLKEKLEKIVTFIKGENEDFQYKIFVDTGPLLDRHVAYRAGLGWYGYNSLLINEKYGSWIFIGYILSNIIFEEDRPLTHKKCYGCNLCVRHCPKGAIEGPYQFNASKCISNILQQNREIHEEDRGILGKNLYGCDICQEVCPHNNGVKETSENLFHPQHVPHAPDLIELLNISNKRFKESYGRTSAGWRGKKILQRNAIIAMVNYGSKEGIDHLLPLLKDPRPEIRSYALWGITQLDGLYAYNILENAKKHEKDGEVLQTIEKCLTKVYQKKR